MDNNFTPNAPQQPTNASPTSTPTPTPTPTSNQQPMQATEQSTQTPNSFIEQTASEPMPSQASAFGASQPEKSKAGKIIIIVLIVLLIVVGVPLLLLALGVFTIFKGVTDFTNSESMNCTSGHGSITIYYNNNKITGLTQVGDYFDYELDDIEKEVFGYSKNAKEGLKQFAEKLENNSNGVVQCKFSDEVSESSSTDSNLQTIGNDTIGYLDIPSDWTAVTLMGTFPDYAISFSSSDNYSIEIDTNDYDNTATTLDEALTSYLDDELLSEDDITVTATQIGKDSEVPAKRVQYDKYGKEFYDCYIYSNKSIFHNLCIGYDGTWEENIPDNVLEKHQDIITTFRLEK